MISGGISGTITRLILVPKYTNEQILESGNGLIAILMIGFGFYNIVMSFQRIGPLRGVLGAFMLGGGIMWVVPLPVIH
ncbi:MAG TPA: hypothetical protein VJ843_05470 [Candidatus Saccharimonadales bacterium]|nr:hypothetical protein [Candidatus Saccharimonadales bacterium]